MKIAYTLTLLTLTPIAAFAHGTVDSPISRVYTVYQEEPFSPDSAAAQAAVAVTGANPYYTWNQISQNIANYNDPIFNTSYSSVIPDGKLASGNNVVGSNLNFAGLDLVSNDWDWPATSVTQGPMVINWLATAPHDPSFFKVWITKADYNHKTPLAWGKMEFLGKFDVGQYTKDGLNYKIPVTLPARSGRHVLYVAWQRIDPVGEVFFSTSDIIFGDGGNPNSSPAVSVQDLGVNENAGSATVTVNLSKAIPAGETASVNYSTTAATATAGSDYTAVSGTLNFAAGDLSKTITIPIINDVDEETAEIFQLHLDTPVNLDTGNMTATVTIQDDDTAVLGGYAWDTRDDWGSGYNGWLTIVNGGTTDLTNPSVVITVPAGQVPTAFGNATTNSGTDTYTISGFGNIPAGGQARIDIGFNNASGGGRGPGTVTINGANYSTLAPAVSIADITQPEGDGAGSVVLTVSLSQSSSTAVHVAWQTLNGSATAGSDYTADSGSLVFSAGETTKNITIQYAGNTTSEGDKDFQVLLSGVTGETPPRFANTADGQATVTLTDDDGLIRFTATGGSVIEGDSGTKNLTYRLFLSRAPKVGETVSIGYMAHGHGAMHGVDFAMTSGTHTFAAGVTEGILTVPVIGDTIDERHEVVTLHFSSPVGIMMETHQAVGQIIDNEFFRANLGKQRVVAYLDGTSGSLNLPPADRVTHIMYAFANLNADGTLDIGASVPGHLATLNGLKSQNPDLKVLISVGGWTWSSHFTAVAADAGKRAAFAESCRLACVNYGLDGIDVDWEWPGVSGGPGTTPSAQDGANYTLLLQALRTALDTEGNSQNPQKHYEISAFTAASPAGISQLELSALANIFDFVNAQGYDLHGAWNSRTGHNAGLHHNSGDPLDNRLNIESVLGQYLAGGFKRSQLLIGAPFYSQVFYSVGDTANGLFQPSSSTGSTILYRDMTSQLQTIPRQWDAVAKVPYLYNRATKTWISYDDPEAMHEKALFSRNRGFGGIYFWRNGGDTADRQLLTAMSDSLAKVDSDSDGIDDGWEISHFGDLSTANATSDHDGDGMSDLAESLAKTNPTASSSVMKIEQLTSDATGTELSFPTVAGVIYQLQTSTTMLPNSWSDLGDSFEGTGVTTTFKDTVNLPLEEKRFYRLMAQE